MAIGYQIGYAIEEDSALAAMETTLIDKTQQEPNLIAQYRARLLLYIRRHLIDWLNGSLFVTQEEVNRFTKMQQALGSKHTTTAQDSIAVIDAWLKVRGYLSSPASL